jgi:tetratricopeptide (TPR) repeat protein
MLLPHRGCVLALLLLETGTLAQSAHAVGQPQGAAACVEMPGSTGAEALRAAGAACLTADRAQDAARLFERARASFEAGGDTRGVATCLGGLGDARGRLGDNDGALAAYESRLALEEIHGDELAMAKALYSMGRTEILLSRYPAAFDHFRRALALRERLGSPQDLAASLNGLGVAHCQIGQFEEGLTYFLRALDLAERGGDKKAIAFCEGNVGLVHKNLGRYDQALEHLHRSLTLERELGNEQGMAETLNNIGSVLRIKGESKEALHSFRQALEIKERLGNPHSIAFTLEALSEVLDDLGDLEGASAHAEKARDAYRMAGDLRGMAGALGNLGEAHLKLGRLEKARASFEEALAIADQIQAPVSAVQSLWNLADVAARQGRYRAAFESLRRRAELVDQTQGSQAQKQVSELQVKYETEKRKREIEALEQRAEIQDLRLGRERLLRNIALGAGLLLVAMGVLAVRRYSHLLSFWRRKNVVGHFRILETIGSGGMGVVYRAADVLDTSREVALKVVREDLSRDENQRRRLLHEGALVDQLSHPNVVRVLERGEHEGAVYIAMELLGGETLAARIRSGRTLTISAACEIVRQLVEVTARIHEKGILHRDLKPDNIMLLDASDAPRVKLLDFGLATSSSLSSLTQTGQVMGTLHYLPPERITGSDFTAAGDLYALGVVFYETLTLQKPFVGDLPIDIIRQILDKDPLPPSRLRADVPPALDDLVLTMLSRDPTRRPEARTILRRLVPLVDTGSVAIEC